MFFFVLTTASFNANSALEIIPLQNRSASELSAIITPLLEGSERVIANRSNLIIKASPAKIEGIKSLIRQLDTPLANLSITVVQSRNTNAQQLNASANVKLYIPLDKPADFKGSARGRFAQTEGFKNSDNTQVIKTLEGQTATIRTGKIHPVQNFSVAQSAYGQPVVSSNTQLIEASTGFLVTPHLTGENQVTLEVTPWSDKFNNTGTIDLQGANTTIRINLGEWVEIGGVDEQQHLSKNKTLSHKYSTSNNKLDIFIKVDKN